LSCSQGKVVFSPSPKAEEKRLAGEAQSPGV